MIWESNVPVSATILTLWYLNNLSLCIRCFVYSVFNDQSATQACNRLTDLQEFRSSQTVKVNPDRPQQQARFLTLEVSRVWMKTTIIISLFPFNQGAFKACARVSELQVFTHTAEVKVDPDKPLEGVRLAVLQVALCEWLSHCISHMMSNWRPNLTPTKNWEIPTKLFKDIGWLKIYSFCLMTSVFVLNLKSLMLNVIDGSLDLVQVFIAELLFFFSF